MKEKQNKSEYDQVIILILIIITIASLLWKTITGFDTDEQCIFATMNRFANGDRYLIDLFDPYQFSALIVTPIWLFCKALNPLNPVIMFRICSILIKLLCGLPFYRFFSKKTHDEYFATLCFLVWLTAFPKVILSLDHSNLTYIILSYTVFILVNYSDSVRKACMLSIFFSLGVLVYPTMVVLSIPIIAILFFQREKKTVTVCFLMCIVLAGLVLSPILAKAGINGLIHSLQMVLMDGSHRLVISDKIGTIIHDGREFLKYSQKMAQYFIVVGAGCYIYQRLIRKKSIIAGDYLVLFCTLPFIHVCVKLSLQNLFPHYTFDRYLLITVVSLLLTVSFRNRQFLVANIINISIWLIALISTNNGLLVTNGYIMWSTILVALFFYFQVQKKVVKLFLSTVLISQCCIMVLTARMTNFEYNSVFSSPLVLNSNMLNHMRIEPETNRFLSALPEVSEKLESDNLIVCGLDAYAYVALDKNVYAPTTISTVVYNQQWEIYIEERLLDDVNILIEHDAMDETDLLKIMDKYYSIQEIPLKNSDYTLLYCTKHISN